MARKKAETTEQTKSTKTAAKTRQNARKASSKNNISVEEESSSQAKKQAVAKDAKNARNSKTVEADETSGLLDGCATNEERETAAGAKKSRQKGNSPSASPKKVIYSLEAGTPIFVKTADICAAIGKSNQWVGQLTSQGVINKSKTNHGSLYEIFDTMRAYCEMLEERAKKEDEDIQQIELKRKKAEARLKESKATFAELETKEFQGKMHRSEDVQAMTADLLYFIRGSLIALAGRCANECAATSEPAEAQKIIERETSAILQEMSNYKFDRKRYDELVRQRMKRELDADYFADDEEE